MKMNSANQLKSKIKNLALEKGVDSRVLFRIYMMERFLDRVAQSRYRERFVLKGGMLISYLVGVSLRTTMDIDTTMRNLPLTEDNVRAFITDILRIDVQDGVKFRLIAIEMIMEEADYPGFRVTLEADFDNTKTPVKIDISTGHTITPDAIESSLPVMFSDPITLLAYPVATVLAEKMQTILVRTVFNTRMRDFYDLHALRNVKGWETSDKKELQRAFLRTCETRNSEYLLGDAKTILGVIASSKTMEERWASYQKKSSFVVNPAWDEVIGDADFFLQLLVS